MSVVISIANNKGGVGKSSLTMNLGGTLAELNNKVLLIDIDPQANLSSVFIDNGLHHSLSVADIIYDNKTIEAVIKETNVENIKIIPANSDLQDIDARLAGDDDAQYFLAEEIEPVKNRYDFILIDCPPSLGKATRMALVAADYVLIPIECQEWAVKGCQQMLSYVERVKHRANPGLELLGMVINRFNSRRQLENIYDQVLRETYEDKIFNTEFRDNVPYVEAVTQKLPITLYQPNSKQAQAYREFTAEVINRVQEKIRSTCTG